jgi:hypothetical protein
VAKQQAQGRTESLTIEQPTGGACCDPLVLQIERQGVLQYASSEAE